MHVGVARPEHSPSRGVVERPALDHVVSGFGDHREGQDHGEMGLDVRRQPHPVALVQHQRPVCHIGESRCDEGEEQGDSHEVDEHRP